jgi:Arc/MetJ-type ribon-helix-helix transcriptional regulator
MPRKKQEIQTIRVPTTLPIGTVELIDSIIKETREFKSRSDFLEKGAFLLIDKVVSQGDRTKSLKEGS